MNDDFYTFDEENYCIKGRRLGRTFQLGEPIEIEVWRANLMKKQLDFRLTDDETKVDKKGKPAKRRTNNEQCEKRVNLIGKKQKPLNFCKGA